jgi:hypothetical protein
MPINLAFCSPCPLSIVGGIAYDIAIVNFVVMINSPYPYFSTLAFLRHRHELIQQGIPVMAR